MRSHSTQHRVASLGIDGVDTDDDDTGCLAALDQLVSEVTV